MSKHVFEIEVNDYTQDVTPCMPDGSAVLFDYIVEPVTPNESWERLERVALVAVDPQHKDHPCLVERWNDFRDESDDTTQFVTVSILEKAAA